MKINEYTEHLSRYLTSLPDSDRGRILDYYREYLADLCEDGMSEEEAVATLPPPFALAAELMEDREQEGENGQTAAPALASVPDTPTSETPTSETPTSEAQASEAQTADAPVIPELSASEQTQWEQSQSEQSQSEQTQSAPHKSKGEFSGLIVYLLILGFPLWLPILIIFLVLIFSLLISLWAVIVSLWAVVICLYALVMLIPGAIVAFVTDGPVTGLLCLGAGLACLGLALLSTLAMALITKYSAKLTAWSIRRMFGWMIPKKRRANA